MQPQRPQPITPHNGPWALFGSAASKVIERAALASHTEGMLMERAGLAVARLALATAPHARRVLVCAGPGNNGGDGLVAARHLRQAGVEVAVRLHVVPGRQPADAAAALRAAQAAGVPIEPLGAALPTCDLVIDALLGLGATRAPEGAVAHAIAALNVAAVPVLAVDLPSGLHPDTGQPLGAQAVRATLTLSLLTLKPGCFTAMGRDHAGTVWLDDLGTAADHPPDAWLAGPTRAPAREHAAHKGSQGDVVVVGGATGMTGAAWLAAQAALAAGAGRVYASLLDDSNAHPPRAELMTRPRWWLQPPPKLATATVACGCGGGDAVRATLPPLLTHAARLVLDADALNAIAADPLLRTQLDQRGARGLPSLLTPHPLEAARLLGVNTAHVQADRLAAARRLADSSGCCVLLKGSGTVIAAPGCVPVINSSGNAALASAGTGDVLAGWAAGLWAQQPATSSASTLLALASAAAWQHGAAADVFAAQRPGRALRAGDLIEALAALP